VAQDDIVTILTNLIDSNNLPHLLLYGPPGMYFVFFLKFDFEFTVCFIIDLLVEYVMKVNFRFGLQSITTQHNTTKSNYRVFYFFIVLNS
jgi:hypothetical protein